MPLTCSLSRRPHVCFILWFGLTLRTDTTRPLLRLGWTVVSLLVRVRTETCRLRRLQACRNVVVPCWPWAAELVWASPRSCSNRLLVLWVQWCIVVLAYLLALHLRNCRRRLISPAILLTAPELKCNVRTCPCATPVLIILRRRKDILLLGLRWWAPGPLMLRTSVVNCSMKLVVTVGLRVALRRTVRLRIARSRLHMLPR